MRGKGGWRELEDRKDEEKERKLGENEKKGIWWGEWEESRRMKRIRGKKG